MNRKLIWGLALVGMLGFASCGGNNDAEAEQNDADSTAVDTTMVETDMEEETSLAFDGVAKGDYTLYGHSEIEASGDEISAEEMMQSVVDNGGFEGKVKVTIDEVCQKAGCWITFANGDKESVRVFFRDHFTIPTETASGTEAILLGQAVMDTLTVDFQKHLLDDAAENGEEVAQSEYDAITEDKTETTFDCEAILVKNVE